MKKMKIKQIFTKIIPVLIAGSIVISCNDKEVPLEVIADVVVITKKIDNVVKRAPAYYVYANQSLEKASVTPPGGTALNLEALDGSSYTLAKEPVNSDFTDVPPAEGNYVFSVTSQTGVTIPGQDAFDFEGLAITQIKKATFSGTPLVLNVEWTIVSGADGYFVKLLDSTGKQIFNGYIVAATVDKYVVSGSSSSGSWLETPVKDQIYTLRVNAIKFDDEAIDNDKVYNISELSESDMQIVWKEN